MADRPKRLERIFQSYEKPIWFLTFNTHERLQLLANEAVHARFRSFCRTAGERSITVGQYVIMPDHVHLFVCGPPDFHLSNWVRSLKIFVSSAISAARPHWQDGFFDRLLRREESYSTQWEYIRRNPVEAGLVTEVDNWPYQGQIHPLRYW